nr:RNA-directed DNA polymerase, eukaryota [Tanacetum cinerariifolium]
EWSDSNLDNIVKILKCFFLASGLKTDIQKSQVLGVGVPCNIVNQAASLIGCAVMQNPFWYLGVMVGDSMSQKLAWADTVQKLHGSLWYRVIQALYGASFELHPVNQSSIWCSILREMQVLIAKGFDFVSHCKKRVGDGHNTRFWYDSWVFDQPLRVRFPRLFSLETDEESTVASKLGSSSVDASFQRSATRWVKYIPIKINVFAWRARLDRFPTRSNLVRRGVVLDSSLCPFCVLVPGDIHHVFFRCDTAKLVFRRICRWWDLDWHDLLSFLDWNAWSSAIRLPSRITLILEGVFYVAWWHLWLYSNQSIFAATPPRSSMIFDDIVSRSFTWCASRCEFTLSLLDVLKGFSFFLQMGLTLILATLEGLDVGLLGDVIGEDDFDDDG